jgi:hypothetical protein
MARLIKKHVRLEFEAAERWWLYPAKVIAWCLVRLNIIQDVNKAAAWLVRNGIVIRPARPGGGIKKV